MTIAAAAAKVARAIGATKPKLRTPARAILDTKPRPRTPARTTVGAQARVPSSPNRLAPAPDVLAAIRTLGRLLDDLEGLRIRNSNRIGALEREYGEALPHLHLVQEHLAVTEHIAELELIRQWRKHPLAPWAKGIHGAGEKLMARLLAEIGDPVHGDPKNENPVERNVAKLWAYCGVGDPARIAIPKGATQEELFKRGRPGAKKAAWKLAFQFMRTPASPYRDVYLEARAKYADAIHEKPCAQCKGKAGSPLSDGHQHARALRKVTKDFLRDLWIESRRLHSACGTQRAHEAPALARSHRRGDTQSLDGAGQV